MPLPVAVASLSAEYDYCSFELVISLHTVCCWPSRPHDRVCRRSVKAVSSHGTTVGGRGGTDLLDGGGMVAGTDIRAGSDIGLAGIVFGIAAAATGLGPVDIVKTENGRLKGSQRV
ncbi:hypothetical protein MMC14_008393 [Varicellaria rhodocarpa]|nr:hypothetical protein [Varicellaria rhodocarpa]